MSVAVANFTTTSAFLYCPPVTQTQWTTVYETILPAACETSSWMATYTITHTCVGDKADYVTPTIPPGFVVTTVSCHACHEPEVVITCPGAQPTGMGKPTVQIGGNGVTATIVASPSPAPANGHVPAAPTGGFAVNWSGGGGGGSGSSSGAGAGSGSGSGSGSGIGSGSGSGSGIGGVSNNGTIGNPPIALTGAAASLKRSLMVGAGLAFLAGPFFLL
ncbi:hypothetical protein F4859DRAFT_37715 [Xylaria cf. heliscus]|nr:hypothetical protein F4859DRAFT_37715 [Xylaria cf. heliscus]